MTDLNLFSATGTLKDDPALRYTAQGRALASATLTVQRESPDGPRTTAVFLTVWGELAERFVSTVSGGRHIAVAGELRNRRVEREDGSDSWRTEIHVTAFTAFDSAGPAAPAVTRPQRPPGHAELAGSRVAG